MAAALVTETGSGTVASEVSVCSPLRVSVASALKPSELS